MVGAEGGRFADWRISIGFTAFEELSPRVQRLQTCEGMRLPVQILANPGSRQTATIPGQCLR